MGGMQFLDIIILVMVAAFIFLRLRSVLGRRTGHEQPPREDPRQQTSARDMDGTIREQDNVVVLNDQIDIQPQQPRMEDLSPVMQTMWEMNRIDGSLDPDRFAQQAQMAYEAIVMAFASGDLKTLQDLLEKDVFENFEKAIDARADANETMTTDILSIHESRIEDATLDGKQAEITIHFETEMISMTKDEDGVVVQGDPHPHTVREDWTFTRRLGSTNPNWLLAATRGAD